MKKILYYNRITKRGKAFKAFPPILSPSARLYLMRNILISGKAGVGKTTRIFLLLKQLCGSDIIRDILFITFTRAAIIHIAKLLNGMETSGCKSKTIHSATSHHAAMKSDFYRSSGEKHVNVGFMDEQDIINVLRKIKINTTKIMRDLEEDFYDNTSDANVVMAGYHLLMYLLPELMGVHPLDPEAHIKLRIADKEGWRNVVRIFIERYAARFFTKDTHKCIDILKGYLGSYLIAMIEFMREHKKHDYVFPLYLAATLDDFDLSSHGHYIIVIDEAQDLNLLEIAVLSRTMKNAKKLIIAGDPDQSIYFFMGIMDPYLFCKDYRERLGFDTFINMTESHRCSQLVASVADEIIRPNYENRSDIPFLPTESKIQAGNIYRRSSLLEIIRPIMDQRTFILTRTNHFRLQIERILRVHLIPYHRLKGSTPHDAAVKLGLYVNLSWVQHMIETGPHGNNEPLLENDEIALFHRLSNSFPRNELRCSLPMKVSEPIPLSLFLETHRGLKDFLLGLSAKNLGVEKVSNRLLPTAWGYRKLFFSPTILVGTIYSAKGWEATNVVLDPRITESIQRSCERSSGNANVMAERRVWYTAVTRTQGGNLYILNPAKLEAHSQRYQTYEPLEKAIRKILSERELIE